MYLFLKKRCIIYIYIVNKYILKIGSRVQVMHGKAKMTSGGLTKQKLKYNKHGKIVSIKASNIAKKDTN